MSEEKDISDFVSKSDLFHIAKEMELMNDISRGTRELVERTDIYLEFMAAAFIKETGIKASECELIMEYNPMNMTAKWHFREKDWKRGEERLNMRIASLEAQLQSSQFQWEQLHKDYLKVAEERDEMYQTIQVLKRSV